MKIIAIILTLILPGAGHLYLGYKKRGLNILFIVLITHLIHLLNLSYKVHILGMGISVLLLTFSLIDVLRLKAKDIHIKASVVLVFLSLTFSYFSPKKISVYTASSESMLPTLKVQTDRLIVYHQSKPQKGDIILFQKKGHNPMLKRVVGIEGDFIEIKNKKLYINNEAVKSIFKGKYFESTIGDKTFFYQLTNAHLYNKDISIKIPKGHYFVLGDNRDFSYDSRSELGLIKESEVLGVGKFKFSFLSS